MSDDKQTVPFEITASPCKQLYDVRRDAGPVMNRKNPLQKNPLQAGGQATPGLS